MVVPLMKKSLRGIVLREHTEPIDSGLVGKIRPLSEIIDEQPIINAPQLALWQWMNTYYMCTLGEVMAAALPSGILDDRYNERITQYIVLPPQADYEAVRATLKRAPKQLLVYDTAVNMCRARELPGSGRAARDAGERSTAAGTGGRIAHRTL